MSTTTTKFPFFFIICVCFSLCAFPVSSQEIEVKIEINQKSPVVIVEGKFLQKSAATTSKNWSFLNSAAGAEKLGERISDLNLADKNGQKVYIKKLVPGEYLADGEADGWTYRADINQMTNVSAMAHVSWLKDEQGILMTGDLLPQFSMGNNQPSSARIKIGLPAGWSVITNEKKIEDNVFEVENIDKAIFLVGKNWREKEIASGKDTLKLAISGEWQFSDEEAHKIAADIFTQYKQLFGEFTGRKIQIALVRFPKDIKFGRWAAETRGTNLTILSGDMAFKTQSLQRLHEQLRHELFHLWIPNNLALTGNYDWFYEGFTVYQSLRTGVKTNQIRFEDFLDTLGQAYNLDNLQTQKVSLVEASKSQSSGANPQVYARGMIAAFLCDVTLLRASKGKRSIENIFADVYQKHRLPGKSQIGSEAILNLLGNYRELNSLVAKYIQGAGKIEWKTDLASVGIEEREENSYTRLKIIEKPNKRQKDLLDELGYNNWRKMSVKAK